MRIVGGLLLIIVLLFGGMLDPGRAAQVVPSWAISLVAVPGVSIGPVQLGMTPAMVFNRLGLPATIERDAIGDIDGVKTVYIWWIYQIEDDDFTVSWTEKNGDPGGVDFVGTTSKRATIGGLVVGQATIRDAVERYGWWTLRGPRGGWFFWEYTGMRLRFDEHDILMTIDVIPKTVKP